MIDESKKSSATCILPVDFSLGMVGRQLLEQKSGERTLAYNKSEITNEVGQL